MKPIQLKIRKIVTIVALAMMIVPSSAFAAEPKRGEAILENIKYMIMEIAGIGNGEKASEKVELNDKELAIAEGIRKFFKSKEHIGIYMPAERYAEDFVRYAKIYGLSGDKMYLVASIAFNESAGFQEKFMCGNNGFGWNIPPKSKCRDGFESIEEAIKIVTWNIAGHNPNTMKFYKDKDIDGIIESYNPGHINPKYRKNIISTIEKMKNHTMSVESVLALK